MTAFTAEEKTYIKNQAITELFKSNQLQKKIQGICQRHLIPLNADIQSDILQVTFENLVKYNTDKFIHAYLDSPNRILGLAVRIALTKGVYKDKRVPKGFNHSIAQQIIQASSLVNPFRNDTYEYEESNHQDKIFKSEDEGYFTQQDIQDNEIIQQEKEIYFINLWKYVRTNLSDEDNNTLQEILKPDLPKLKGKLKKAYMQLLPKIKILIRQYQNQ